MALSAESLVLEVGRALAPLEQRLRAGEVSLLFAEIGLPAPDAVLGSERVRASIAGAADALAALPEALSDLSGALASADPVEIARAAANATPIVKAVFTAIEAIAAEVEAAAESAGPGRAEVEAFAAQLADRLFGFALAIYLERRRPVVAHLFALVGILEITAHAATPAAPAHVRRVLRFDRFGALIDDPLDVLAQVYGWGGPDFDWNELLLRLSLFLGRVSDFAFVQPGSPPFLRIALVDIGLTDDPVPGVQAVLRVESSEGLDQTLPIGDRAALTAIADAAFELGTAVELLPPADLRLVPPSSQAEGRLRVGVRAPPAAGGPPIVVLGVPGGSRVEARVLRAAAGADLIWNPLERHADGELVLEAALEGGKAVLTLAAPDGFLARILPGGPIELDLDLLVRWSSAAGVRLHGDTGLRMTRGVHRQLGPLRLDTLDLAFAAGPDTLTATLTITGAAVLGPVTATVASVGTAVALRRGRGNLGLLDVGADFVPPARVGLSIDSAAVTGGGFLDFDPDKGQYAGVVQLHLEGGMTLTGVGLIATRLPGGASGFSLLIVITAEGFRPIPLPLGFKLTGIGGLLAINRTFDEAALRAGLKNHTLDSVLLPTDPIRNAPQIISNLNHVFPAADGHHLFGPILQLTWGTPALITADLAVVLELGARLRLLVLAQIVAVLPSHDNDLIRLQMDAVGVFDFDQGMAALDATLHDSRLLRKFVLTGDMAMRLNWAGSPNFALAVGGLHPAFNPPPNFPKLERIAISLASGDNPRIRCEAYFALTSNSVQFGARAELHASASGFSVQGEVGFDVLIQLAPFAFLAEFYAQLQLKRGSTNLFKVRVEGALAGPRPLHLKAKATFEILWWDASITVNKTLVEGEKPPLPAPVDVLGQLQAAVSDPGNWVSQLPAGQRQMVTLRAAPDATADVLLHPLGTLTVKQNVVPLDMDISRFGQSTPAGARRFTMSSVGLGGPAQPIRDFFAPAQFFELSDDEKLSRPSFEPLPAGVSIGSGEFSFSADAADRLEVKAIEFDTLIVDKEKNETRPSHPQDTQPLYRLNPALLGEQARFGAAGASALRRTGRERYRAAATAGKYRVAKEGWNIVDTDGLVVQPMPGAAPMSYSEAEQALRTMRQQHPLQAGRFKTLRLSELSPPST